MFVTRYVLSTPLHPDNEMSITKKAACLIAFGAMACLTPYAHAATQSQSQIEPALSKSVINTDLIKATSTIADTADSETNIMVHSQATQLAKRLIQLATNKKLATHSTWLRLHYYHETPLNTLKHSSSHDLNYASKVEKPDFFISKNGKNNPQAELEAFITKLVEEGVTKQTADNESVACRFPARTHWVSTELGIQQPSVSCPKLDAWMQKIDPQRFSIVFAGEYPDRPVSAFGHTLLLIDSTASLKDPTAVDKAYSLNDTVGGDPNDPFLIYAAKSFSGGYPNEITIQPYTKTLKEYLQVDNRDVWTYALDLSQAEVHQIMRHVWETKDLNLPYYFTLDNCASEILRYIDVVRPEGNLLDQFKVAVVPKDVIQLLDRQGLIVHQSYLPSDKTLAQAKRNYLKKQQQQQPHSKPNSYPELNPQLNELSQLPSSSLNDTQKLVITDLTPADNNALDAHARQQLMVGAGSQDDTGYLSLAYRGGFNGPLDHPSGYPQHFHLETGAAELRVYKESDPDKGNHDRVELQALTILRGRSFNPINTARNGDSLLSSWGVNLQATQVKDGAEMDVNDHKTQGDSHLVGSFSYEKGLSFAFGTPKADTGELPPHLCYALGTGTAQVGKSLSKGYRVGAGVNLGCHYQLGSRARVISEVQLPYWYHGSSSVNHVKSGYWQPILSLGAQYDIDKNQAIRLQGSYELQNSIDGRDDIQLAYIKHF